MTWANLIGYAAQAGTIVLFGLLAPRVLGLRQPGAALRYWQALLAVVLLLPVLQPRRLAAAGSVTVEAVGIRLARGIDAVSPGTATAAVTELVLLALAAIAVAKLLWIVVGLLVLRSYRLRARPLDRLPAAVELLAAESGRRLRFMVSDRVPSPITFGWWRPTVLVPAAFENLSEAHQTCIGCHELIHVKRRDWLAMVLEQVLRAVLWFHPAVVILLGRIELSREQMVDREVVRLTGDRRAYLEVLLVMAHLHRRRAAAPALFLLNRSDLRQRIVLLAQEVQVSKQRVLAALVAAVAVVTVAGVSAAALFPLTTAGAVSTAAADAEHVRQPVRYDPDAGMTAPKIIHKVNPVYPEEAKKNGTQGTVVCETLIDDHGEVVDVKVVETPDEVFNQPTIDAIGQWKFEPATKDGKPVDVIYTLTVKYALE